VPLLRRAVFVDAPPLYPKPALPARSLSGGCGHALPFFVNVSENVDAARGEEHTPAAWVNPPEMARQTHRAPSRGRWGQARIASVILLDSALRSVPQVPPTGAVRKAQVDASFPPARLMAANQFDPATILVFTIIFCSNFAGIARRPSGQSAKKARVIFEELQRGFSTTREAWLTLRTSPVLTRTALILIALSFVRQRPWLCVVHAESGAGTRFAIIKRP